MEKVSDQGGHTSSVAVEEEAARTRNSRPLVPYSTAKVLFYGLHAGSHEVEMCVRRNGEHRWSEFVIMPDSTSPKALEPTAMAICARCCVRRCGLPVQQSVRDSICIKAIHHSEPHRDSAGKWREFSGG